MYKYPKKAGMLSFILVFTMTISLVAGNSFFGKAAEDNSRAIMIQNFDLIRASYTSESSYSVDGLASYGGSITTAMSTHSFSGIEYGGDNKAIKVTFLPEAANGSTFRFLTTGQGGALVPPQADAGVYDELSYLLDLTGAPNVSRFRAHCFFSISPGVAYMASGSPLMLHKADDPSAEPVTVYINDNYGQFNIPTALVGQKLWVSIPITNFASPADWSKLTQTYLQAQNGVTEGHYFIVDNIQLRESGAPYLTGSQAEWPVVEPEPTDPPSPIELIEVPNANIRYSMNNHKPEDLLGLRYCLFSPWASFNPDSYDFVQYANLWQDPEDENNLRLKINPYTIRNQNEGIRAQMGDSSGYAAIAIWLDANELLDSNLTFNVQPSLSGSSNTYKDLGSNNPIYLIPTGGTLQTINTSGNRFSPGSNSAFRDVGSGWVIIPFESYTGNGTLTPGSGTISFDFRINGSGSFSGQEEYMLDDLQMLTSEDLALITGKTHKPKHNTVMEEAGPEKPPLSEGTDSSYVAPTAQTKEGVTVDFKLDSTVPSVGGYVTGKISVQNDTDSAIKNVTYNINSPYQLVNTSTNAGIIQSVAVGEKAEISVKLKVLSAGRGKIGAKVTLSSGTDMVFDANFSVAGAGWYGGDTHTHSIWSDGGGSIRENTNSAYSKLLSWMFSTEHGSYLGSTNKGPDGKGILPIAQAQVQTDKFIGHDFITLAGVEITTGSNGHANAYFINDNPEYKTQQSTATWNTSIAEVVGGGGLFSINHAFSGSNLGFPYLYDVTGYSFIEVWNGSTALTDITGRRYLKAWDDLNTRGRATDGQNGKIFGIAGTDAHSANAVGNSYTSIYLPTGLTEDNINAALKSGNYFGTNGPQLRFDINGIQMGQTLKYTTEGETVSINIHAFDYSSNLTKVRLIRNAVTGQDNYAYSYTSNWTPNSAVSPQDSETVLVKEWILTDLNTREWSASFDIDAGDNDFYRIEVESEKGKNVSGTGFAFSNPIWLEKDSANNYAKLKSVSYDGVVASKTAAGDFYIPAKEDETIKLDKLSITSLGSESVVYDAENDMFGITLSNAGNVNEYTVCVVRNDDLDETVPPETDDPDGTTPPETDDPDETAPDETVPDETAPPQTGDGGNIILVAVLGIMSALLLLVSLKRNRRPI